MKHIQFIEHAGKQILICDCAKKDRATVLETLAEAKAYIAALPPRSLLAMLDVTGIKYNTELSDAFKEFAAHNKPYSKASAIVGIGGLQKIAYTAIMTFTDRNVPLFNSRAEALDWLVKQE